MLKLNAIKSDKIWGYELWIASTHPNGCQAEFKKACGGDYPLLVKVIQANEALSIQVHPDDKFAVELEGEGNRGKTECWYILSAEPDAKLVYGIKEGYSKEELAQAIRDTKLEGYLDYVAVKPGDFVFIPAGTVHAIGGGIRLMEVQQSCDLTYRLYDYGRGREVHIEKGLSVIKREEMIPVAPFPGVFECDYFRLEKLSLSAGGSASFKAPEGKKTEDWQLFYVISSDGTTAASSDGTKAELSAEEIYAVAPGETVEFSAKGSAEIMHIIAK